MSEYVLEAVGITKSFIERDKTRISILKGIDISLEKGKSYAVVGKSGSGKSTLLEILASLLPPDSGNVHILGEDISGLSYSSLASLRNQKLGFIFQNSQLLADFNALENVMMPLLIKGERRTTAENRAKELLSQVGLTDRFLHKPGQLSGGECQRVAVARALACNPQLVFADEPTGSLDEGNAKIVEDLLLKMVSEGGYTLLLVTHNMEFASRCQKVWNLHEGLLS